MQNLSQIRYISNLNNYTSEVRFLSLKARCVGAHSICLRARHMRRGTSAVLHARRYRTPTSARIVLTTRATCPMDGATRPAHRGSVAP